MKCLIFTLFTFLLLCTTVHAQAASYTLSWPQVAGATSYTVTKRVFTLSGTTYTQVGTPTTGAAIPAPASGPVITTVSVPTAENHTYEVSVCNVNGCTTRPDAWFFLQPSRAPLPPPTNLGVQ